MKKFFCYLIIAIFILFLQFCIDIHNILPVFANLNEVSITPPINAEKNANIHNKRGLNYFKERDYYAALKEFKIAIAINPNSQSTAVYYNNLGKVYLIFGEIQKRNHLTTADGGDFLQMARVCFERAIMQDCMKFEYYNNLVNSYEILGITNQKKEFLIKNLKANSFNAVPAAIILAREGQKSHAVMLLNDFIIKNPDLIITDDVKKYVKSLNL